MIVYEFDLFVNTCYCNPYLILCYTTNRLVAKHTKQSRIYPSISAFGDTIDIYISLQMQQIFYFGRFPGPPIQICLFPVLLEYRVVLYIYHSFQTIQPLKRGSLIRRLGEGRCSSHTIYQSTQ